VLIPILSFGKILKGLISAVVSCSFMKMSNWGDFPLLLCAVLLN